MRGMVGRKTFTNVEDPEATERAMQQQRKKREQQEAARLKEQTRVSAEKLRQARIVNHHLREALWRKRMQSEELEGNIATLDNRIERASLIELPARANLAGSTELGMVDEQQYVQEAKLHLGKGLMEKEEEVESLVKVTAELREQGAKNRGAIRDQHAQVKDLQRQVKEMRKHIDILEGISTPQRSRSTAPSESSLPSQFFEEVVAGPEMGKSRTQDVPTKWGSPNEKSKAGALMSINELQQLPGLDLQALLADTASPHTSPQSKRRGGGSQGKSRVQDGKDEGA